MSRGARESCKHCGTPLKMRGAWICEPCYRIHHADDIERERQRRAEAVGADARAPLVSRQNLSSGSTGSDVAPKSVHRSEDGRQL